MPSKKKETEETQAEATPRATETSEETSTEAKAAGSADATEEKPKRTRKTKADNAPEEPSFVDSIIDTVSSVVGSVAETVGSVATTITDAVGITGGDETVKVSGGNRAQRIGVVTSDKMTKTVVVRVDRLIKHPKYRRYVRRKKQFMAHDELGATTGDKVRIVETRPLSARKRWRVIEIVQKAAK
ncbi:MAG: 30S ribosomal protein S17 [Pyrinomonadaceae bacterium]